MRKLAILGASGHGKVVAEIAELNGYKVDFYDDNSPSNTVVGAWITHGDTRALCQNLAQYDGIAVGIGNSLVRAEKMALLSSFDAQFPILIHPTAMVSRYASLGVGSVVMANATVNVFSKIDDGVIVNTGAVIEHDCVIEQFAHICPSASIAGNCHIGEHTWVGIGSCIKQQITVGGATTIGAGSVVVKNIPAGVTAFGNPARIAKD
ncbi:acetyltransferase [Pseudoalteromonas sp. DY56-GL79]|uniref:acetyltransferase n=1 Tax=Pseudoalteromonas sp. DY56-GL79 TaxID=2967131 RepID=UPI00352A0377